jgi:hypothetical protein
VNGAAACCPATLMTLNAAMTIEAATRRFMKVDISPP